MPEHQSLIALGANLGDASATLQLALEHLEADPQISVCQVSSFISNTPVGGPVDQPLFVNAVAEIQTRLAPKTLLAAVQRIEKSLGRIRSETWAARSLDLDILSYDKIISIDPLLILPHPRMSVRRFVMDPLAQILPEWQHPQLQWSASRLVSHLETAPRAICFMPTIAEIGVIPAALDLFKRFSELAPGWEVTRQHTNAMFEVYFSKDLTDGSPWRLPRFYPTADDPETLVKQAIATCRGMTELVFAV